MSGSIRRTVRETSAMDRGRYRMLTSGTAAAMAALRAAGAAERDPNLRHPDYLARKMLPLTPHMTVYTKFRPFLALAPRVFELVSPGVYYYELARGKHMDKVLADEISDGLDQLVVLGAGYDTRAHRFADALDGAMTYEVDHPLTQEKKRRSVERIFGKLPETVRYVSANLEVDNVLDSLVEAGYMEDVRTLFILSGVSGYLTDNAMSSIFRGVAERSGKGSSIVFDYWHRTIVQGDYSAYGAYRLVRRVERLGEPFRSGIDPAALPKVLSDHGLQLISDLSPRDMCERYLVTSSGATAGRPYEFLNIAHARVSG
ncbi:SAM-dependent methyltransferase [Nocardia sp. CDC159]|uniref:S-adenosyl-L-methionine-dependent methyltransferase n=1 Tax=Nocardia pulmonis TaxID=2951408 RepID=A0A9X2EEC0_9NOCA|nr:MULTISPECIES: SAM-dependent methyltransferase [Nocardia]MCM6776653.1 SAM-dependent methyltransferase [Nocardia pulmonis]MCM6789198.1 SAM-dependent methyltransferase [Nocardia sp. CDC159]